MNAKIRRISVWLLLACLFAGPVWAAQAHSAILMIGDGMGAAHVEAAAAYAAFIGRDFALTDLMEQGRGGLVSTFSANSPITDSAAAATALACGVKTNNGMLGVTPQGEPVRTVLEQCKQAGKKVGLITTTRITDATPAGFASHVTSRGQQEEIAAQLLAGGVDLLMGGGRGQFVPAGEGGVRKDGRNLLQEAERAGYSLAIRPEDLKAVNGLPLLGLFAESELGYTIDKPKDEPTLAEMTAKALELLPQEGNGFFLMVEGAMIDYGAHANDLATMIGEALAFDEAVRVAREFVAAHPDTLLIVTADHETGGLTLTGRPNWEVVRQQPMSVEKAVRAWATLGKVPYQRLRALQQMLGAELSVEQRARLLHASTDLEEMGGMLARMMSEPAGVSWSSHEHPAAWVPVVGIGPGSELLRAFQDNTDVSNLLRLALGLALRRAAVPIVGVRVPLTSYRLQTAAE